MLTAVGYEPEFNAQAITIHGLKCGPEHTKSGISSESSPSLFLQ